MGKNSDREVRIMDVVESLIVHNPQMDMHVAVSHAVHFVDLRQRRLDSAEAKDKEERLEIERKACLPVKPFTEANEERSGLREWDQ